LIHEEKKATISNMCSEIRSIAANAIRLIEEPYDLDVIRGRGPTIYKIDGKSFVEIPELMEFIKEEKRNFRQGTRPGYIEPKLKRRIAAEYALTKLQTLILRNELDKSRTPDEIREISMRYRRSEDEL
jgi:hypothetical protein